VFRLCCQCLEEKSFVVSSFLKERFLVRIIPVAFLLLSSVTLLTGCGRAKEPWETAYPVSGVVTYKGKPVADAELSFFPEDPSYPESVRPRAKSDAEGKFNVWTYEQGDGAPAGKYKVTVVHFELGLSKDTVITRPNDLPAKYSRLDSTDLVVEVSSQDTALSPINLQ
jgi:hypothetical protein